MRILFITINNPFGVGGGDFATHAYLKAFSQLSEGNVDVFMRDGIKVERTILAHFHPVPERPVLARLWSVVTGHIHRNVKAVRQLLAKDAHYDYCVFNSSKVSPGLIDQVKSLGIKTITIHHNVEAEFVRDNTPNPMRRAILIRLVMQAERKAYQMSDYNLFLTRQDMETFHRQYGENRSVKAVIGTFEFQPLPVLKPKAVDTRHLTFAITGTLCLQQGIDGVKYFFEELYQYLPEGSQVIISGRNPTSEVTALCGCHANVQLIPNPADMSEIINKADIYICPTRLGGGLKLRVMDGLRLGIPVITHVCAARGYEALVGDNCLSMFSDQQEFASGLRKLVADIQRGAIQRNLIRQKYEEIFSQEAGFDRLRLILPSR